VDGPALRRASLLAPAAAGAADFLGGDVRRTGDATISPCSDRVPAPGEFAPSITIVTDGTACRFDLSMFAAATARITTQTSNVNGTSAPTQHAPTPTCTQYGSSRPKTAAPSPTQHSAHYRLFTRRHAAVPPTPDTAAAR
jgi:hypothetical protein